MLDGLRDSHSSMARIMDSLLDISKLDAGVVEANIEPIRLDMMIDNLMKNYSLIARKKNISIRTRLIDAVVASDLAMLECILNNLISNAVCYTEKGGSVLVACRRRRGRILVEIWDSGIGIPDDQMKNIFAEFYQLSNPERANNKGLGLGLSIVNRLVHLLPGHDIEVSSRPGHGSRFRISMPEALADAAIAAPASLALQPEPFAGMRVLLLEDDLAVRRAAVILMQQWGCEVMGAGTAAEAVSIVKNGWIPDAMIADYRLPGDATGMQAVQTLRLLLKQALPALIISGESQTETIQDIEN
ncbi:MAG: hybrid sensor histidine kinase/response regulator, partial [Mariprofundaceae bacterium]|nr:hybrid sensor histidine kinase/response regulator [Mariprofundaceae bacterium]